MSLTPPLRQRLRVLEYTIILILVILIGLLTDESLRLVFWLTSALVANGGYAIGLGIRNIRTGLLVIVVMAVTIIVVLTTASYISDVGRMQWFVFVFWAVTLVFEMANGRGSFDIVQERQVNQTDDNNST